MPAKVIRNSLVACLVLSLAASLSAEVKVFKNFTLIDGTGRPAVTHSAMILDNGRIEWVGPVSQLKAPAEARVFDLKGRYVIPGLIDDHVHLGNVIGLKQDSAFFTRQNVEKDLKTYASYGVTTVLSLGTDKDLIFKMRSEQRATDDVQREAGHGRGQLELRAVVPAVQHGLGPFDHCPLVDADALTVECGLDEATLPAHSSSLVISPLPRTNSISLKSRDL